MRDGRGRIARAATKLAALAVFVAAFAVAAQADPLKIRIAWIVAPAELTPYMFMKPGIAVHNGVSYVLEPVHFQGTSLEINAVEAGELDIAPFGSSSFALAVENAGMDDLRILADEVQDGVPGWSGPEFQVMKDSPIKSVDDLRGKVLATNAFGGETDMAIRHMLQQRNMLPNRDFTEIQAEFGNMYALAAEHKADLVVGVHPFQDLPDFANNTRTLFTTGEALGRFEVSFWTARTATIAAHRAVLIDLIEDYVRAIRWYNDPAHRDEALQIVADYTKRPVAAYDKWLFLQGKGYYKGPDGVPDIDAVSANVHLQHELGLVKGDLDAKNYADLSLIKAAIARLK